jgi:hypothetical protein
MQRFPWHPGLPHAGSVGRLVTAAVTALTLAAVAAVAIAATLAPGPNTLKVRVGSTCSVDIKGASVYVTAVPYNQFSIPAEELTGDDGTATLVFRRDANFPASGKQQQLTLFIRATKPGEDKLAGVSTRRLVAVDFSS